MSRPGPRTLIRKAPDQGGMRRGQWRYTPKGVWVTCPQCAQQINVTNSQFSIVPVTMPDTHEIAGGYVEPYIECPSYECSLKTLAFLEGWGPDA